MNDFLAGFGALLGTLQTGSIAEWVSAIATVGALFWAFRVFRSDRVRASQAEANRFSSYIVSTTHTAEVSTAKFEFFNAGDTPVPLAYLIVRQPNGDLRVPLKSKGGWVFRPGDEASFRLRLERHSNDVFTYVYFHDSHGRVWLRDIRTGKYVSLRREVKGPWLRYNGSLKARWRQFAKNHTKRLTQILKEPLTPSAAVID